MATSSSFQSIPKWKRTLDDLLPKRLSSRSRSASSAYPGDELNGGSFTTALQLPQGQHLLPLDSLSSHILVAGNNTNAFVASGGSSGSSLESLTLARFRLTQFFVLAPATITVFSIVIISTVFISAFAQDKVSSWPLPFISQAAGQAPESAIFGVGMSLCAFVMAILCCVQFWSSRARFLRLFERSSQLKRQQREASGLSGAIETSNPGQQRSEDTLEEGLPLTAKASARNRKRVKLHWFQAISRLLIVLFLISGLISALALMMLSIMPVYIYHEVHDGITGVFFFGSLVHVVITSILDILYATKLREIIRIENMLSEVFVISKSLPSTSHLLVDEESGNALNSAAAAASSASRPKSKLEVSEGAHITPLLKRAAPKRMLYARLVILAVLVFTLIAFPIAHSLRRNPAWFSVAAIFEYMFVATVLMFHLTYTMDFYRLNIDISIRVKDF